MRWWQLAILGVCLLIVGFLFGRIVLSSSTQLPLATSQQEISPTAQPVISSSPTIAPTTSVSSSNYNTGGNNVGGLLPTAGNGPQNDIIETSPLSASQPIAQVGDDITYTVTLKNQALTKKNVQLICFNSSDGNFGCLNGKNLQPGESFTISNSGRFSRPGTKTIWVTWSQDSINFYVPVGANSTTVTIQG